MEYRNKTDGTVVSEQAFRESLPQVSLPETIDADTAAEYNMDLVYPVDQPTITAYQTVTLSYALDATSGKWQQVWTVTDLTDPDQIAAIKAAADAATKTHAIAVIQKYLDTSAQAKGYDDIKSAALRAGYAGPYQAEGTAFAIWMDACWAKSYTLLADVLANVITVPTDDELIAQMPVLSLPSA